MHPRNRHQDRYDLRRLAQRVPELAPLIIVNKFGDESLDFAQAQSVKLLNKALLLEYYGLKAWDLPEPFLCPPVPGRADYVHTVADLIRAKRGPEVRVLDIGVGANLIYPIIGRHEYGWSFVGTDINPHALAHAQKIIDHNPPLVGTELRLQTADLILKGMIAPEERFELSLCNPPFHASLEEANASTQRKWKNLGLGAKKRDLNFGGEGQELWTEGGEKAFVIQMIKESLNFRQQVRWFTTLVSNADNLPVLEKALAGMKAKTVKVLPMGQGQKQSRVLAWSFTN
jgi:23S rRNA (adenine1618-N6)-methyltransferase